MLLYDISIYDILICDTTKIIPRTKKYRQSINCITMNSAGGIIMIGIIGKINRPYRSYLYITRLLVAITYGVLLTLRLPLKVIQIVLTGMSIIAILLCCLVFREFEMVPGLFTLASIVVIVMWVYDKFLNILANY